MLFSFIQVFTAKEFVGVAGIDNLQSDWSAETYGNRLVAKAPVSGIWVCTAQVRSCSIHCYVITLNLKKVWSYAFAFCYFNSQALDSDGSRSAPVDESERPDLSILKPLWSLYTSMLEKEASKDKRSESFL